MTSPAQSIDSRFPFSDIGILCGVSLRCHGVLALKKLEVFYVNILLLFGVHFLLAQIFSIVLRQNFFIQSF